MRAVWILCKSKFSFAFEIFVLNFSFDTCSRSKYFSFGSCSRSEYLGKNVNATSNAFWAGYLKLKRM